MTSHDRDTGRKMQRIMIVILSVFFTTTIFQQNHHNLCCAAENSVKSTNYASELSTTSEEDLSTTFVHNVVLKKREAMDSTLRRFPARATGYIELGKVVRRMSSYLDVSITRFEVPLATSAALLELSAYKRPRSCISSPSSVSNDSIIVYFQHGSTPLVLEKFFPLPPLAFRQRTNLIRSAMLPDQRSYYLLIDSPRPGSWFMVAFLNSSLTRYSDKSTKTDAASSTQFSPAELRYLGQSAPLRCSVVLTSTMHVAPRIETIEDVCFHNHSLSHSRSSSNDSTQYSNDSSSSNSSSRLYSNGVAIVHGQLSMLLLDKARAVYRMPVKAGLCCSTYVQLVCSNSCRLKFRFSAVPTISTDDDGADSDTVVLACLDKHASNDATSNNNACSTIIRHRPAATIAYFTVELLNFGNASTTVRLKRKLRNSLTYNVTLVNACCQMPTREPYLRSSMTSLVEEISSVLNYSPSSRRNLLLVPENDRKTLELTCPSSHEKLSRIDYGIPFSSRFFIKRSILPFLQDLLFISINDAATTTRRSISTVQTLELELYEQDSGGTLWFRFDVQDPYSAALAAGHVDLQFCLGVHRIPFKVIQNSSEVWCEATSVLELRITNDTITTLNNNTDNNDNKNKKKRKSMTVAAAAPSYTWEIYVPYPEPGIYYLAIISRPIVFYAADRSSSRKSDIDGEIEDEMEKANFSTYSMNNHNLIVIQFQAMMQQCYDGSSCNRHGRCRLSLLGSSSVSTACECHSGYGGLDCSDATHATSDDQLGLAIFALTASNAVYIPAAIIAWRRLYRLEAILYIAASAFSTVYHLCDRPDGHSMCLADYQTLQFADFYAAVLSIWLTIIALAELPPLYLQLAHIVGSIGIAVAVRHNATAVYAFLLPLCAALAILAVSWTYRKVRLRTFYPSVHYIVLHFTPGICVAIIGLIVYGWCQTESNYHWTHSFWHIIMGVAIVIILPTRRLRYGNNKNSAAVDDNMPITIMTATAAVVPKPGDIDSENNLQRTVAPTGTMLTTLTNIIDDDVGDAETVHVQQQQQQEFVRRNSSRQRQLPVDAKYIDAECNVSLVDSSVEHVSSACSNTIAADDDDDRENFDKKPAALKANCGDGGKSSSWSLSSPSSSSSAVASVVSSSIAIAPPIAASAV